MWLRQCESIKCNCMELQCNVTAVHYALHTLAQHADIRTGTNAWSCELAAVWQKQVLMVYSSQRATIPCEDGGDGQPKDPSAGHVH